MKKYNHAYSLGFSVNTDRAADELVDPVEIMEAIALRIVDVTTNKGWDEAIGLPFDSFENEEPTRKVYDTFDGKYHDTGQETGK